MTSAVIVAAIVLICLGQFGLIAVSLVTGHDSQQIPGVLAGAAGVIAGLIGLLRANDAHQVAQSVQNQIASAPEVKQAAAAVASSDNRQVGS